MYLSVEVPFLCAGAALCPGAFGQAVSSSLVGTLTDPANAMVPGAKIRLDEMTTAAARTAESNTDGLFRFTNLPPGTYTLTAQAQG